MRRKHLNNFNIIGQKNVVFLQCKWSNMCVTDNFEVQYGDNVKKNLYEASLKMIFPN